MIVAWVLSGIAFAGSQVEVTCPSGRPVFRYKKPERACAKLFESQFARDFSLGIGASLDQASVSADVKSAVVRLADDVNGDIQAHYKGACAAAQNDPCGPGMEAFTSSQGNLAKIYVALRARLAGVRTMDDVEALRGDVEGVRGALATDASLSKEILEKVDCLLNPECSGAGPVTGWAGTWTVETKAVNHSWTGPDGMEYPACPTQLTGATTGVWTIAEEGSDLVVTVDDDVPGQEIRTAYPVMRGSVQDDRAVVGGKSATGNGSTRADLRLMPDGFLSGGRVIWGESPTCVFNFQLSAHR